jgi:hypothetical protein
VAEAFGDHEPAVLLWDGASWTDVTPDPAIGGSGIRGFARDDVWMAGADGIFHWDGASWSAIPCAPAESFAGIWGASPDELWTVGTAILHRRQ